MKTDWAWRSRLRRALSYVALVISLFVASPKLFIKVFFDFTEAADSFLRSASRLYAALSLLTTSSLLLLVTSNLKAVSTFSLSMKVLTALSDIELESFTSLL